MRKESVRSGIICCCIYWLPSGQHYTCKKYFVPFFHIIENAIYIVFSCIYVINRNTILLVTSYLSCSASVFYLIGTGRSLLLCHFQQLTTILLLCSKDFHFHKLHTTKSSMAFHTEIFLQVKKKTKTSQQLL